MTGVPVICDRGHYWMSTSILAGGEGSTIEMSNVSVGPCPQCGAMGKVPDARYRVKGGVLVREAVARVARAITDAGLTPTQLAQVQAIIEAEQDTDDPTAIRRRVEEVAPNASGLLRLLSAPAFGNVAQWLSVILMVLIALGKLGPSAITADEMEDMLDRMADRIVEEMERHSVDTPAAPTERIGVDTVEVRKVPRNSPCPCGSGRKYKVCHGRPSGPRASDGLTVSDGEVVDGEIVEGP